MSERSERIDKQSARARRLMLPVVVATPGLILAGFGLAHPHVLTAESAGEWWRLHVWLLPVFPLLAGSLVLLLGTDRSPVAWAARAAGFGFAVGYTALDVLDGIGAGLTADVQGRVDPVLVGRLFEVGDRIGHAGVWCLLAAGLLTALALWPRHGAWVVPGAALFGFGCVLFREHHIFAPGGVWAMLLLAGGSAMLAAPKVR